MPTVLLDSLLYESRKPCLSSANRRELRCRHNYQTHTHTPTHTHTQNSDWHPYCKHYNIIITSLLFIDCSSPLAWRELKTFFPLCSYFLTHFIHWQKNESEPETEKPGFCVCCTGLTYTHEWLHGSRKWCWICWAMFMSEGDNRDIKGSSFTTFFKWCLSKAHRCNWCSPQLSLPPLIIHPTNKSSELIRLTKG